MPKVFDSSTHKKKGPMKKKSSQTAQNAGTEKPVKHRSVDEYSDVLAAEPQCARVFTSLVPKPQRTSL